jgi:NAD(P)-dependent dehydrogenase (short-subunit alcohol dehydrogenase family)
MGRLDGKVAVVTGSARGIGRGIAERFAHEGADIVLNDLKAESMDAAVREIEGMGRRVIAVAADISTKEGAKRLIDTAIEKFEKVDILVNNAGVPGGRGSLLTTIEEDWDRLMSVDLKGVFLCSQAVAKSMMERKYGKIINISSSGVSTASANLAYSAAKAGVIQVTKVCARELGSYGVNVNCIAPGSVVSEMTYTNRTPEEVQQRLENKKKISVLHRLGTQEDMASLAVFLATDESSFITGQTIFCDGGRMDRM